MNDWLRRTAVRWNIESVIDTLDDNASESNARPSLVVLAGVVIVAVVAALVPL